MSDRQKGWYWVKGEDERFWQCCQWNGYSWHGVFIEDVSDSQFDEIGPRIPAPNEAPPIGQRYRNEAGEVVAVTVPALPDWGMLAADGCSKHHEGQECLHHDNRRRIWRAMLDAIPDPSNP